MVDDGHLPLKGLTPPYNKSVENTTDTSPRPQPPLITYDGEKFQSLRKQPYNH